MFCLHVDMQHSTVQCTRSTLHHADKTQLPNPHLPLVPILVQCKVLIEQGAAQAQRVDLPVDRWGKTPLDDARRSQNPAVISYLNAAMSNNTAA